MEETKKENVDGGEEVTRTDFLNRLKDFTQVEGETIKHGELIVLASLILVLPLLFSFQLKLIIIRQIFIALAFLVGVAASNILNDVKKQTIIGITWTVSTGALLFTHLVSIFVKHTEASAALLETVIGFDLLMTLVGSACIWWRNRLDSKLIRVNTIVVGAIIGILVVISVVARSPFSGILLIGAIGGGLLFLLSKSIEERRTYEKESVSRLNQDIKFETEKLLFELRKKKLDIADALAKEQVLAMSTGDSLVRKLILLKEATENELAPTTEWALTSDEIELILSSILNDQEEVFQPAFLSGEQGGAGLMGDAARSFLMNNFTSNTEKMFKTVARRPSLASIRKMPSAAGDQAFLADVASNWNFDQFTLFRQSSKRRGFVEFGQALFNRFSVESTLRLQGDTAAEFLAILGDCYLDKNPYHNAMHAADVANDMGFFLLNGLGEILYELEASALLVAALAHDVAHPGYNNAFMISAKTKQALVYNDQSVLENFHAACLYQIFDMPKANITKNLPEPEWKTFRKLCLHIILDTDLQKHFLLTSRFKSALAQGNFDPKEETNRMLLLSGAIKCGDIGHGAKELGLHKLWSRRVIEEFWRQGDEEVRRKLPISPLCDRSNKAVGKSQEGFLKAIVLPLYEVFTEAFKGGNDQIRIVCLEQVKANMAYWGQEAEREARGKGEFLIETRKVLEEIDDESNSETKSLFLSLIHI
eukprot:TRINITY_DN3063_c0_g1_i2.p1 TRINITY_DN3063_c0_g1~~TRINITY_DN3063_c0_g1_i2.p1  ORF type:complete len:707 (+),score=166.15 TRINITY_DN3063_c0_g1_i2:62-2182(+)